MCLNKSTGAVWLARPHHDPTLIKLADRTQLEPENTCKNWTGSAFKLLPTNKMVPCTWNVQIIKWPKSELFPALSKKPYCQQLTMQVLLKRCDGLGAVRGPSDHWVRMENHLNFNIAFPHTPFSFFLSFFFISFYGWQNGGEHRLIFKKLPLEIKIIVVKCWILGIYYRPETLLRTLYTL